MNARMVVVVFSSGRVAMTTRHIADVGGTTVYNHSGYLSFTTYSVGPLITPLEDTGNFSRFTLDQPTPNKSEHAN